ncbi:MAG: asparagine synthase (glutamine-hydrolyzing) [Bacteroidota bacterium]
MCGIAGIISKNNQPGKELAIREMTEAIAHRGPDAGQWFVNEDIAFGHRRLSIIDLSEAANQPMWDNSGRYVILYNGEVYNFEKIKNDLPGYDFKTTGDNEVVLAAFIKWGADCLQRLEGMFAFAVWDTVKKELFAARDRLGIKPFYYFKKEELFIFSSELRGLLASGMVPKKIKKTAVNEYLNYQTIHAPNTIIENVFQLMPGEFATLKKGEFRKKKYWSLVPKSKGLKNGSANYETVKKEVRRLMFESVEKRLISDVPLGAFLSGGIDSSAIVAIMSEVSEKPAETFSVVFEEKELDESKYSNLIAKKYKTNHHPILLKPTDFLDSMPAALAAMDVPSGDGVNTYVVSKVTREAGITVALSGLGGDEIFAGYSTFMSYYNMVKKGYLWKIPKPIRSGMAAVSNLLLKSHQRSRVMEIAGADSTDVEHIFPAFRRILTQKEIGYPTNSRGQSADWVKNILTSQSGINELPVFSQISVADISTYTQNILLRDSDQMSMAVGLELRVPFFDYQLVEYAIQVPDHLKYPSYAKKLLVESLSPLIPEEIVHRPKLGFVLPWRFWMKNELRSFCEKRLGRFKERNLVSAKKVDHLWDAFLKGKNDFLWSRLWILIVLEDWLQRNIGS